MELSFVPYHLQLENGSCEEEMIRSCLLEKGAKASTDSFRHVTRPHMLNAIPNFGKLYPLLKMINHASGMFMMY